MKIEQLIVQYLYQNKKVMLQDIGTFSVADDITIPTDIEKDTVLPENAIQFEYNPKANVDEGLIAFIIENTRKIKPLATSDLESFVMLNKQFLNIGKPLVMEGVGILQKINDGSYTFVQSGTSHVILKETPKVVTEKLKEKISFSMPAKEGNSINKKMILLGLLIMGLLAISAVAYYFLKNNNSDAIKENEISKVNEKIVKDTLKKIVKDTMVKTNANNVQQPVSVKDSNTFYVIIKDYQDLEVAKKRLEKLVGYGNKLLLTTKDSIIYKIKMPFKLPLTDTLRIKDSLNKFFQAKTYIEVAP